MVNMFINPGTHADASATVENAEMIAATICKDLGISETPLRVPFRDRDGWFSFDFRLNGRVVDVDIPGDNPETVCEGRAWVSRRLYVDGNSWLYGFALGSIARRLGLEEDA